MGNYGINRDDYESIIPTCKGVVVFEEARRASNWRNQMTLDEFLKAKKIPGISGIDTRALTKIIRKHGTMRATLTHVGDSMDHVDQLQVTVLPTDNIKQVSTKTSYPAPGVGLSVVLVDFGLKHSILRELSKRNCNVTVVPYSTTAEEILHLNPDGVMLSNGPGNPEDVPEALDMIRGVQGKFNFRYLYGTPTFLPWQTGRRPTMKFGHRGFNHAVRESTTGRVDFTSQNHGYAVSRGDLPEHLIITTKKSMTSQLKEFVTDTNQVFCTIPPRRSSWSTTQATYLMNLSR